jgi:2-polyprenyl-3-methyl-5-hydroxy-6-metoxy-1,4-benzoquinol methylase
MKLRLYHLALQARLGPTMWLVRNPLKIYEFTQLTKDVHLIREDVCLDLGCGGGIQTQVLASRCRRAVGVDTESAAIADAQELVGATWLKNKIEFHCNTIQEAKFADGVFDHVFSFCVLEHIPDLSDVLRELHRVMKPNGGLHVTVDSLQNIQDPRLLAKHRADHCVHQYFTRDSLISTLEAAGFQVDCVFPMFSSAFARLEFERRIREGFQTSHSVVGKLRLLRHLETEEQKQLQNNSNSPSIMLIAHARRR